MSDINARARAVCRILVIRPNHRLGNNVLLTPLLSELEALFPGAEVEVLTGGGAAKQVFAGFKRVTTVHAFPNWSFIRPHTVFAILQRIRKSRYDLAIDASARSRSGRFLLGLVTARYRIGYAWGSAWRDRCLSHAVVRGGEPPHMALTAAHLVRAALSRELSLPASVDGPPLLDVRVAQGERAEARALLSRVLVRSGGAALSEAAAADGRVLVSLYPFATAAKNYPEKWWLQVAAGLRALSPRIDVVEIVPGDGRPRLQGEVPALYSTRIRELAAVIGQSRLFVSGDCGVMHLGSAAGAQVLGLFKVTDPSIYAPYGRGSEGYAATDDDPSAVVQRAATLLGLT
ncbi:MAG: glycosyltransferase family 9 protein [Sinobacteraceae bacterium]|nr:glycosyltransferase family 9 protein [Nevskiaceae bacterium]